MARGDIVEAEFYLAVDEDGDYYVAIDSADAVSDCSGAVNLYHVKLKVRAPGEIVIKADATGVVLAGGAAKEVTLSLEVVNDE